MAVKYAINGFGRIGRSIVRANTIRSGQGSSGKAKCELVAVNDLTDAKMLALLLKHDSVHREFPGTVEAGQNSIIVNGKEIKIFAEKDPTKLPWASLGVDVVLECTGLFTKREKAAMHLQAGAKKVIISGPSEDADATLVYGVNHSKYNGSEHQVLSNGSCTTNCLAPIAKTILENFGIVRGMMTTVHSYTNDQNILDLPHKDPRRARAAALSMIPTTTGAAKALSLVIPELKGKLDGLSVRVPTPNVSLVDLVVEVERDVTVQDVNNALISASKGALAGVLSVSEDLLVSSDFNGSPFSSIVDLPSTMVTGKRMVKILSWYDNEMGFSYRMNDILDLVTQ